MGLRREAVAADAVNTICSPAISQGVGVVIIKCGKIDINRPMRAGGPTLAQIRVAVQAVIDAKSANSKEELEAALNEKFDVLEKLVTDVADLRRQMDASGVSADRNYIKLEKKITEIIELIDRGQTLEAQSRLDDIFDLTRPSPTLTLRGLYDVLNTRWRVRSTTIALLRNYELAVWPENVGTKSLTMGLGGAFGSGSAEGGYAAPSPEHAIIGPVAFDSRSVSVIGTIGLVLLRDKTVSVLASLEIEVGAREYEAKDSDAPNLTTLLLLNRLSVGVAIRVSRIIFVSLSGSVGYEPWARRPVYTYTGVGASYEEPKYFGGFNAGLVLSLGLRK